MTDFATNAREACNAIAEMLIAKNRAYGDSALNPIRVFSKGNPSEGIRLRIDDKLSRIARGEAAGEDTITDLIGYLIMLQIAERPKKFANDGGVGLWTKRQAIDGGYLDADGKPKPRAYDGAPLGDYADDGAGQAIDGDCMTGTVSGVKAYPAGDKPAWCTKPGWNGFMVTNVPHAGTSRIDLEAFKRQVEEAVKKAQDEGGE